jgi:hypothetical protein
VSRTRSLLLHSIPLSGTAQDKELQKSEPQRSGFPENEIFGDASMAVEAFNFSLLTLNLVNRINLGTHSLDPWTTFQKHKLFPLTNYAVRYRIIEG